MIAQCEVIEAGVGGGPGPLEDIGHRHFGRHVGVGAADADADTHPTTVVARAHAGILGTDRGREGASSMTTTHTYAYRHESGYSTAAGLGLATAGGREAHPFFFRGFVDNAAMVARGLLAVAEVSRTRYFDAGAAQRMRDPVVTSNRSVVRFEAFSACNGVYARLDVDDDGFDAEHLDWGTTNVDVNEPLRAALSGIMTGEPLRFSVGDDALAVDTMDAAVIERRVPLPNRWLRGFAEVQIDSSLMAPVLELDAAAARVAIRDLPRQRTGNQPMWLKRTGRSVRLSPRPDPGAPAIVGPQRLAALARLLPDARSLTVFAPPRSPQPTGQDPAMTASAWTVGLDHARLTVIVSPELYRGFSGEGAVLSALADADDAAVAVIGDSLAGQAGIDPDSFAAIDRRAAADALVVLGALGRVGHDLHGGFFHRDLPFDRTGLDDMHPRLVDAKRLVAEDRVQLTDAYGAALVRSESKRGGGTPGRTANHTYVVGVSDHGPTCTCRWFAKHDNERGPCKHILAAQLVLNAERSQILS